MLALNAINTFYEEAHILHDVSLHVEKGDGCFIGPEWGRKTTTLRSIIGLTPAKEVRSFLKRKRSLDWWPMLLPEKGSDGSDNRRISHPDVQRNLEIARRTSNHKEWILRRSISTFNLRNLKTHKGEYSVGRATDAGDRQDIDGKSRSIIIGWTSQGWP